MKSDFRDNYPFGLFAVPMEEVVRIHASSGTTGKPTVVGYTQNDINLWSEVMARTMGCAGITRKDVHAGATATGCSPAGWACTTARSAWAPRSSRSPAATPSAR